MRRTSLSQIISSQRWSILVSSLFVPCVVSLWASAPVQAGESPEICPAYEIEGSIEPAANVEGEVSQASVYVHTNDQPLVGQTIFATFTIDGNEPVGEPVMLTTDSEGRAFVAVPAGATSVSFVAEGPDNLNCLVPEGSEPSVALEIFPPSGIVAESGEPWDRGEQPPGEELAYTGPVTAGVIAVAVLVAAMGCGVWIGRGRKVQVSG